MADLTKYAAQSTVNLTTVGRTSGQPRTVKIWFVVDGAQRILVQHVRGDDAHWYRNLRKNGQVEIDFGDGPLPATATPLRERGDIDRVLNLVRRKYWVAWLLQTFLARNPVAASIDVTPRP